MLGVQAALPERRRKHSTVFGRNREKERLYAYDEEPGKTRHLLLWSFAAVILLAAAVIVTVRITTVRVIGNKTYTAEQVEDMVFPGVWDRSTVICLLKDRFQKHRELPFIEDYDIQLTGPFSCDLVVYEKSIVGYIRYMSSYMYFDKDGVIVENAEEQLAGVPEITGLQFGRIVLNEPLPVADQRVFSEILNITQQLGQYGISSQRIAFDSLQNVTVTVNDGSIDVQLGSSDKLDEKLSVLQDMLPELESRGLAGTLDLTNYSDNQSRQITSFKVRKEAPEEP